MTIPEQEEGKKVELIKRIDHFLVKILPPPTPRRGRSTTPSRKSLDPSTATPGQAGPRGSRRGRRRLRRGPAGALTRPAPTPHHRNMEGRLQISDPIRHVPTAIEKMDGHPGEKLDEKPQQWSPETAELVRDHIIEIMEPADQGLLDLARSRQVEQGVLDLLHDSESR